MTKCNYFIAIIVICIKSANSVPFLVWNLNSGSSDNGIKDASAPAGLIKFDQLISSLNAPSIENGILIDMEELCNEDIAYQSWDYISKSFLGHNSYGVNYQYQPKREGNTESIVSHFVDNGFKKKNINIDDSTLPLEESKNLLIISFNNINTNPKRSDAFRKIDEVLKQFFDEHILPSNKKFTVMFSGKECPQVEEKRRVSRSLKEAKIGDPKTPDNFYHVDCIYLYFRKLMTISLTGEHGTFSDVPVGTTKDEHVSSCTNGIQQWITLSYSNVPIGPETYYKLKLTFRFNRHLGSFYPSGVEAQYNKGKSDKLTTAKLQLVGSPDTIPIGHSYACGETLTFVEKSSSLTGSEEGMTLKVNGWQVQAFMSSANDRFGPSWDCVGFFTTGIWMGLLTALMLISILSYGMAMIVNIKTMDRFDDPKGKTVFTVQQTE